MAMSWALDSLPIPHRATATTMVLTLLSPLGKQVNVTALALVRSGRPLHPRSTPTPFSLLSAGESHKLLIATVYIALLCGLQVFELGANLPFDWRLVRKGEWSQGRTCGLRLTYVTSRWMCMLCLCAVCE